jgi:hypothetical protein
VLKLYAELQPGDVDRHGQRRLTREEIEADLREGYAIPDLEKFVQAAFGEDAELAPLEEQCAPEAEAETESSPENS